MKKSKTFVFLVVFCILSCTQEVKKDKDLIFSMNQPMDDLNILKNKIIMSGNIEAYNQLNIAYLDQRHEEFLIYAILMANKYNYPKAYYDVFSCICDIHGYIDKFYLLDSKTRQFAIDYLIQSVQKGYEIGKRDLSILLIEGKYIKKDVKLGNKYILEYNNYLNKIKNKSK